MICPRCNTENDNRTICKKCGYYLYRADAQNRKKMTRGQLAVSDAKIAGKKAGKIFRYIWIGITIIVLSFWLVAGMVFLISMIGG